jgi:class I fructose-bisphosphate aldolase
MNGIEKNTKRLFGENGKTLWIALDHPQFFGPMEGLENPVATVDKLLKANLNAVIINPGVFRLIHSEIAWRKSWIMRTSVGGSCYSDYSKTHPVVVEPQQALLDGADAAIIMFILGSQDYYAMENIRRSIEKYHQYSLPVIVEVMAEDFSKTNDVQWVRTGARIAAELGADIVKVFFTDSFEKITGSCPVPVVLAGGPKNQDILLWAKEALQKGAKGFAFWRNVFQSENPVEMVNKLALLLAE